MTRSGVRRGLVVAGVLILAGAGAADLRAQAVPFVWPGNGRGAWGGHRTVEWANAGEVRPHSWIRGIYISPAATRPAARSGGPNGFWPVDMQTAYGVNAVSGVPYLPNGLAAGGAGVTVAIVDAYDSPNALADLNTFSSQFGLPGFPAAAGSVCAPTFSKVSQTGTTRVPRRNSGWEVEINLDVQWVHAMAPCANILLVEATSSSTSNLLAALTYARNHAQVVSMSWGGGEFSGESSYDSYFQTANVAFLASSGDTGGIVEWPSVSGRVVGVGGTNLPVNSSTGGLGTGAETAWNGSGGGCSSQEPKPSSQSVITFPSACSRRGAPDVAASGGPNSAVAVYVSKQGGWFQVYGTSLACPMWAGMVSIADSLRIAAHKTTLTNSNLADVYNAYSSSYAVNYTDITQGTAGKFSAVTGWDFVTGLGSPKTNNLVPYFVSVAQ
jgi:subtilase family serine protease